MTKGTSRSQPPTVSEARRERERAERTERIMDVARRMFVRDGYEAVTLRKLAKEIEYSPAAIYQYFKDKEDLIATIIEKDQQELHRHILTCMEVTDPQDRIVEMALLYAQWGVTYPNHYLLQLMPPKHRGNRKKAMPQQDAAPLYYEVLGVLHETVKEMIERGMVKEKYKDPSLVAATMWAAIHGVIMLEITMRKSDWARIGNPDISFEERFLTLQNVFSGGLLKAFSSVMDSDNPSNKRK